MGRDRTATILVVSTAIGALIVSIMSALLAHGACAMIWAVRFERGPWID